MTSTIFCPLCIITVILVRFNTSLKQWKHSIVDIKKRLFSIDNTICLVSSWAFATLNTGDMSKPANQAVCVQRKGILYLRLWTRYYAQWLAYKMITAIARTMTVDLDNVKCPIMRNIIWACWDSFIVSQKTSHFLVWLLFCAGFFQVSGDCWLVRIQNTKPPHGRLIVALQPPHSRLADGE